MSLPLADRGRPWDASEAEKRVRTWAKAEDGPNAKYAEAFFYHAADAAKFGDYKLPFADVIGDKLTAIPRAIFAVAAVLQGGRGGVDIPAADKARIKEEVAAYYARMRKEFDDASIKAPWERSEPDFTERDLDEVQTRDFDVDGVRVVSAKDRTVDLSFSSETPIQRPWGREILDHTPGSIRMTRLNNGAPVLLNHDPNQHVGVVEKAFIGDDRKGSAHVRFSNTQAGQDAFQDVQDGIRRGVSVGYRYHAKPIEEDGAGGAQYRFMDWEPLELTLASLPADASVGVGRSINQKEGIQMPDVKTPEQLTAERAAEITAARTSELDRMRRINALAAKWGQRDTQIAEQAPKFIENGKSVEEFRDFVFERLEAVGAAVAAKPTPIGLTTNEKRKFNLTRLINHLAEPNDRKLREIAGFEVDVIEAAAKLPVPHGGERRGVHIPVDVLMLTPEEKREIQTTGTGGDLVATNLLAQDFIDILRINTQVMKLGPTVLPGLVGNVAIPAQTGAAAVYWVAESTAPTESDQVFAQVTLSPKTISANTKYSRKTLLQATPAIEGLVRTDLAKVMGIGVDLAAINGSGAAGQPTGILNVAGIGSVAIGANGGTPTWGSIVQLEEQLGNANALMGNLGFLTNSRVSSTLKQTAKIGSTYPVFLLEEPYNELLGYKFVVDNNIPNNLTKGTSAGVCSAMIFGNWSDLLIGEWGGFDMIVDPYSFSTQGGVQITVFQTLDIQVRHAVSFAADVDYTTL